MAWRIAEYLLEGELDNTVPGKVTGWMRFAGMDGAVTFDLEGDFHRDIRGAKIHLVGDGVEGEPKAAEIMGGFGVEQVGQAGDITAGLPPQDYSSHPYIEWYSARNGRVVIELSPKQVQVVGRPIPASESEPISREKQERNMAGFLAELSAAIGGQAMSVGPDGPIISDAGYSHWVIEDGRIVGEAHSVEPLDNGQSLAAVRLFADPDTVEYGHIESSKLQPKPAGQEDQPPADP